MARSWSQAQSNSLIERLRAAASLEQEITLSPEELDLLLTSLNRLAYAAGRGQFSRR